MNSIRPEEITELQDSAVQTFFSLIDSEYTKRDYERRLKRVLCSMLKDVLKGNPQKIEEENRRKESDTVKVRGIQYRYPTADFEDRANELVSRSRADPKWATALLLKIIDKLKERSLLPETNPDYLKKTSIRPVYFAVQGLLEMNEVSLPYKKIRKSLPSGGKDEGREWTLKEIQKMLRHANIEDTVMIFVSASSGMRPGGLSLRWENFYPIYKYNENYLWQPHEVTESVVENGKFICAMIRVYAGESEEYFAFVTPECWYAIEEYRESWEQEIGKPPKPDDPFFKSKGIVIKPLSEIGLRTRLVTLLEECNLRKPLPKGKRRHDVPPFKGFRYFFDKRSKQGLSNNAVLAQLILKEKMMGHDGLIQLNKNYFREHIDELIKEYISAIPHLTINDSIRKQFELDKTNKEKSELEKVNTILQQTIKEKDTLAQKTTDAYFSSNLEKLIHKKVKEFMKQEYLG